MRLAVNCEAGLLLSTVDEGRSMKRRDFLPWATAIVGTAQLAARATAARGRKIRIGQIGVSHGHANKIGVYRQSDEYEVVGIVEPDENLRQRASDQAAFRDLPWMSLEQLLNQSALDAVLIETTPRDSLAAAEACILAGKHVHLDKPAGESLSHFERLLDRAKADRLLVQMGYMYRYNPGVTLLHQCLQEGWLGDVFEVHAVMSKVLPPADRILLSVYPGGMMFELGCHLIDLIVGMLGEPQKVNPFVQHVSQNSDALQDNMLAVLEYPRALASVKSSAQEVDGFARRHLVVCGTRGTLRIQPLDNPTVHLTLSEVHAPYRKGYQEIELPQYSRYVADAAMMAAVIRGERQPDYSYDHDLAVQRTVLAASGCPLD